MTYPTRNFVAAALLLGGTLAGAAQARDATEQPRRIVVKTSDLDLRTASGIKKLRARVARAATAVCDDYPSAGRSFPPAEAERCKKQALHVADTEIAHIVDGLPR